MISLLNKETTMSDEKESQFISKLVIYLFIFILIVYHIWEAEPGTSEKLANIFSFISSLGILATIGVYFAQKRNNNKIENERLNNKGIAVKKTFRLELEASILIYEEIFNLINFIKNEPYTSVKISENKELVTFYVHNGKILVGQFHMEKHSTNVMKDLLLLSVDVDDNLYQQLLFCYNSIVTSNWFLNTFILFHKTMMDIMKIKQRNIILTVKTMNYIIFNTEIHNNKYSELLIRELKTLKEIHNAYYL